MHLFKLPLVSLERWFSGCSSRGPSIHIVAPNCLNPSYSGSRALSWPAGASGAYMALGQTCRLNTQTHKIIKWFKTLNRHVFFKTLPRFRLLHAIPSVLCMSDPLSHPRMLSSASPHPVHRIYYTRTTLCCDWQLCCYSLPTGCQYP